MYLLNFYAAEAMVAGDAHERPKMAAKNGLIPELRTLKEDSM